MLYTVYAYIQTYIRRLFPVHATILTLTDLHESIYRTNKMILDSYKNVDGQLKTSDIIVDGEVRAVPDIEWNPPSTFKVEHISLDMHSHIESVRITNSCNHVVESVRRYKQTPIKQKIHDETISSTTKKEI